MDLSARTRDQRISPLRLSDQWISAFSPKLPTLCCLFKSHAEIWTSSSPHVFSVYGRLSELTYFRFFFSVICWSYLRKEISVPLSIGDKLYSSPSSFIFLSPVKPLCWCYFATALNLLISSTSPAKSIYYNWWALIMLDVFLSHSLYTGRGIIFGLLHVHIFTDNFFFFGFYLLMFSNLNFWFQLFPQLM